MTCRHVSKYEPLDLQLPGISNHFSLSRNFENHPKKLDISKLDVQEDLWSGTDHSACAMPPELFAFEHAPTTKEEMMFHREFAGENDGGGQPLSEPLATGYTTQVVADGPKEGPDFHLFWDPRKTEISLTTSDTVRQRIKFENPKGFSGSFVWNTRFCEVSLEGKIWSPTDARVTGLICRWDEDYERLIAMRVEQFRDFLFED